MVRIRVPTFSVVYFSSGLPSPKKRVRKGTILGDLVFCLRGACVPKARDLACEPGRSVFCTGPLSIQVNLEAMVVRWVFVPSKQQVDFGFPTSKERGTIKKN